MADFRGQKTDLATPLVKCTMSNVDRDARATLTVYDWAKAASFLIHLRSPEDIESAEDEDVEEEPVRPKLAKAPSLPTIDEEPSS